MPSVIRTVSELRERRAAWRGEGLSVGFVPTMGALHRGHASLLDRARAECDRVLASVFVNPIQFDRAEDLDSYPRTFDEDMACLEACGADAVFMPTAETMYADGNVTRVVQTGLTDHLCGATRPGHFDGVLTVVLKLFNVTTPDIAYFGQKDYQQAAVIRRMVEDLDVPVEIRVCPIVREDDGLALSSRNRNLTPEHREAAPGIRAAMRAAEAAFFDGLVDAAALRDDLRRALEALPGARIDYAEVFDPDDLVPRTEVALPGDLVAVAVFFGEVRLIDNLLLGDEDA